MDKSRMKILAIIASIFITVLAQMNQRNLTMQMQDFEQNRFALRNK